MCPSCGTVSRRVHSRYRRRVTDLPLSGRIVQLLVIARRFRCDTHVRHLALPLGEMRLDCHPAREGMPRDRVLL
ncbi:MULTISPECIES: transposase family protein [unclassified Bradyrhizobium]|uniref:transposase family protein n=1 Tax=unclassified Bradyrhizobium TaxID=2631580 RepID=UPI00209CAE7B|nr:MULTISPECIES: transposase family protein [unclassified Bradyrhizobium]